VTWQFGLFVGLLLATGAMRLVELAISVRRMRATPDGVVAEPKLFPVMALLHFGLVLGPLVEVYLLERPFVWALGGLAFAVLVAATVLRVWTLKTIGRAWNVRVVRPDDNAIATTGPYAWIRHPNYLVVIMEIAALPLLHTAWISAITLSIVNAAVLYQRILTEEATLEKVPSWRAAMADRARLLPGVF